MLGRDHAFSDLRRRAADVDDGRGVFLRARRRINESFEPSEFLERSRYSFAPPSSTQMKAPLIALKEPLFDADRSWIDAPFARMRSVQAS